MRFGVFIAPFHTNVTHPTLALERDIELVQELDRLGYDEAWIGEHHSGGAELVCSPEIMLAVLAERTKHIRLGTGVISLSYHHPLNVVERMVLLDHLTRGRVMMGVGPGALVIDAYMRGIDPRENRPRMAASLEAIMRLLRGERVSVETEWFRMHEAHLHLAPYTQPHFEVAVAALISPSGPSLAARLGCSLLSMGATLVEGVEELAVHWDVMEEVSAAHGVVPDRSRWRLLGPMHLAPTREQAMREVEHGLPQWLDYHERVANLPIAPPAASAREAAELVNEMAVGVIGTPADAAAQLERLVEKSGGFGTYLFLAHEWADREATLRSYRLFAEQVMPEFQGRLKPLRDSWDWAIERKPEFLPQSQQAIMNAVTDHYGSDHERVRKVRATLEGSPPPDGDR